MRQTLHNALSAWFLVALVASSSTAQASDAHNPADDFSFRLGTRLDGLKFQSPPEIAAEPVHAAQALTRLYSHRERVPLWFEGGKPTSAALDAVDVLERSHRHGLDPADYHHRVLEQLLAGTGPDQTPATMLDLELLLSDGLLRFAAHLISGRTRAGTFDPQLNDFRHELDLLPIIEQAAAGNPEQVLRRLEPSAPSYRQLMAALERHRTLEQQGGWPTVPPGPVLAVGDHAPELRLQALRSRLQASGDLEAGAPVAEGQYSVELADAVRRFQDNHGLTVDGKLGPTTNKELAVPAAERSNSIALTLERLRWLPRDLGQRYLRVDIAAATLALVENGRQVLDMRVIVGQARRPTAIFSDQVRYLVFYPYWEVPHTLAVEDELPKIQADPSWIEKRDFEVLRGWGDHARIVNPSSIDWASLDRHDFPYRLRQRPGRSNALGRIKFMFPNAFDIYLHDTPRRDLFERSDRRLSSGCVRLENPIELAAELLEGTPLWDRWRIDRVLAAGNQTTVSLLQPVPIHLVYFTAWPDEQGAIHFRRDIYGLDAGLSSDLGR